MDSILKKTNEEILSQTIAFLRFPLIVGVVLIHSKVNDVVIKGVQLIPPDGHWFYDTISYLFSDIFARIAVPLFFFISGFLFFYKTPAFTKEVYGRKLKKRVHTLLIPYIFWNFAVALLILLSAVFFSGLKSEAGMAVCDYTFQDWLLKFWYDENSVFQLPINGPLWFLRDLMVVMLFSPLVYWVVKKLKQYVLIVLGIFWVADFWFTLPGFSITALFFFSFGAYFSIHGINFAVKGQSYWRQAGVLYLLLSLVVLALREYEWCTYLENINILIGMFFAVSLTAHFIGKGTWRANKFLSESSFFIYAYHGLFLGWTVKVLCIVLHPQGDAMLLLVYFLSPAIIILAGLGAYYVLKKYLPLTTAFITGGR